MLYDRMRVEQRYVPVGIVRAVEPLLIETRYVLSCGDRIEHLGSTIEPDVTTVVAMHLQDGAAIHRANPGNLVVLDTEPPLQRVKPQSLLRKHIESS